jgi:acyl dehydratase
MIEAGMEPAPPDWPKAGDEIRAQKLRAFCAEALARYAAVSGDDNPLHLDPTCRQGGAGLAGRRSMEC